jgi:hypothetical protein
VSHAPASPPAPTSPAVACNESNLRPSALAALDLATRLSCYGGTTVTFEALLLVIEADIDYIPFEVPPLFWPVWLGDGSHPVFVADIDATGDVVTTSLPLLVSDPSVVPEAIPNPIQVRVEGHFDDPASAECRRPTSVSDFPDITDDQAIESCRGRFIVTSLIPLD